MKSTKTEKNKNALKLTITENDISIIECLDKILSSKSDLVRRFNIDGNTYLVLSDVCKILSLSNTTNVMRKISAVPKRNDGLDIAIKRFIETVNRFREVHLITVEAVFQVIMQGRSKICRNIVNHLSCRVLPTYADRWS